MKDLHGSYTHCPMCGSMDFPLREGVRRCLGCGFLDFNNPITAVAVWVLDEEERLLLIERAREPGKGKWAPPGGFVDAGESLEEAAIREVKEETGVDISALTYVSSAANDYIFRGLSRPVCDVFFLARVASVAATAAGEEVSGWRLIPIGQVQAENLAFPSMRHSLACLRDMDLAGPIRTTDTADFNGFNSCALGPGNR